MQDSQKTDGGKSRFRMKWTFLLSLIVILIGCIGYFSLPRGHLLFYVFAHLGALGVLGLIGGAAGLLARRKSRSYVVALLLGIILPIVAGIAVVMISGNQVSCGGSISLIVAILVVAFYALIRRKGILKAGYAG